MNEEIKLYVDLDGHIWRGPNSPEENLHYERLHGVTNGLKTGIIGPVWIDEKTYIDRTWLIIGTANFSEIRQTA